MTNLLDNSAKYSGKEVNITINCVVTDSGSVRISIADDGIGISSSDCRHIFEKFYRVPTGNLHDIKGSGLGLYYANLIIKEHGGSISVKSILGRGTEFIINLPE